MSFQLYLRPHPRTFYLISSTHVLLFKQPDGQIDQTLHINPNSNSAVVELLDISEVDLAGLIKCNSGRFVGGVLGLLSLPIGESEPVEATHIHFRLTPDLNSYLLVHRGHWNIRNLPRPHFLVPYSAAHYPFDSPYPFQGPVRGIPLTVVVNVGRPISYPSNRNTGRRSVRR
jgi:hypothetical protein